MTQDEKIEHKAKAVCYLCGDKFNGYMRNVLINQGPF